LISLNGRDIQKAVDEARKRVGSELAELLTAEAMTEEEMDEVEEPTEDSE